MKKITHKAGNSSYLKCIAYNVCHRFVFFFFEIKKKNALLIDYSGFSR